MKSTEDGFHKTLRRVYFIFTMNESSLLSFIEIAHRVAPSQRWLPAPPSDKQIWPLLLRHSDAVEEVFVFANHYHDVAGDREQLFAASQAAQSKIIAIGRFERLSAKQFKSVERLTFDGGHFNVLYQIAWTQSLLLRLAELWWPYHGGQLSDEHRDDLGLKRDDTRELAAFVESVPATDVLLGFRYEGRSACIFGVPLTLARLFEHIAALEAS